MRRVPLLLAVLLTAGDGSAQGLLPRPRPVPPPLLDNPQCPNGQCPLKPPGSLPPAVPLPALTPITESAGLDSPDGYRWLRWDQDPTRVYLYKGRVQVGAYDVERHYYRELTNGKTGEWAPNSQPPIAPPGFGVDMDKLPQQETYRLNGREVPKDVAMDVIGNGLADDSGKLRVTVVDADRTKRRQVVEELKRMPESDSFAVREYDPKSWEMSAGFQAQGSPTIYCQAPSGKVLHRQDDYAGGAEPTIQALRKARAGYDPKKDPDLRKPQLSPQVTSYAPYLLPALGGVVIALLYLKGSLHASH